MRRLTLGLVAAAAVALMASSAMATHKQTGNGAPNGSHETLNIVGVDKDKNANMKGGGSVIFAALWGNTKILLCESGTVGECADDGFYVIDKNGTDGVAKFALPNPDPTSGEATENDPSSSVYSVFARALGTPGGSATITTCATDINDPNDPNDDVVVCTTEEVTLVRGKGKVAKFSNVTKNLLYIYATNDGALRRYALFDDRLEDYFWDYDNRGLRLAQLRFYPCSTVVPGAGNAGGDINDIECFSGDH